MITLVSQWREALLGPEPDLEVVGEATNRPDAVAQTQSLLPDVVLMDLRTPDGGGIAAIREIARATPNVREVLVLTLFEDEDSVLAALRAGARGYVLKDTAEAELLRAIRAVAEGEAIFSPTVATRVLHYFAAPHPLPPAACP
jgi:DNA-binding NarL/FixJ family response regulator